MPDRRHVLVVDDEPQITTALRLFFESHGLRVSTARDGHEALRQITTTAFDAVITICTCPTEMVPN